MLFLAAGLCRGETDTAGGGAAGVATAGEVVGRVLVRVGVEGPYRGRAEPGLALRAGEVIFSSAGARVEWRFGERGRWRVGERAVWSAEGGAGDAELRAGTALAAVPEGERWTVRAEEAGVEIGAGVWLITAVENGGLKMVALDGGEARVPGAEGGAGLARLRAGEAVFVRPGGRGFGPVVTVFLDELLATSRLITRFKEELPQMERLRQQGAAQRERLRLVSNAHVGGAKDAEGFQVVVPRGREAGRK
jgi:hypothetical protein